VTLTPPEDPGSLSAEQEVLDEAAAILEEAAPEAEQEMDHLDTPRRLLLVHAHPDDESIVNGVTMAKYAAEGALVTLVTCTLGEEGEVLVPELAHLAADREDALGPVRVQELATAMEALGVTDHRFLGEAGRYRDSGMQGLPTNDRPDAFWQADVDTAAADLVAVIREVRPQVLVTYDERGGYDHPDHVQANRVSMRAVDLAADANFRPDLGEPWAIGKVYWTVLPESRLRTTMRAIKDSGLESAFDWGDPDGDLPYAVPDEQVTTAIDGAEHVAAKLAAMRAHATQITVDGPFFALSNNLGNEVWASEYYRLVRGELGAYRDADGRETDLFDAI
jgi:N-acetyl-1-D-myo-inositol-2-amino-2-deoxy-alpha-D-glucopyranoside deacetylase